MYAQVAQLPLGDFAFNRPSSHFTLLKNKGQEIVGRMFHYLQLTERDSYRIIGVTHQLSDMNDTDDDED